MRLRLYCQQGSVVKKVPFLNGSQNSPFRKNCLLHVTQSVIGNRLFSKRCTVSKRTFLHNRPMYSLGSDGMCNGVWVRIFHVLQLCPKVITTHVAMMRVWHIALCYDMPVMIAGFVLQDFGVNGNDILLYSIREWHSNLPQRLIQQILFRYLYWILLR